MDLFIVWNCRRSIDCYTVLGARHSRTIMAKPNLFLLDHGGSSYRILEESVEFLDEENTISCHSFRAGIPSVLSLFPDLVSDDEIKGWGRWRSDSYQRYCRMQLGQKRTIFDKIAVVLNKSLA